MSIFRAQIRIFNALFRLRVHRYIFTSNHRTSKEFAPILHWFLSYSLEDCPKTHNFYISFDLYNWYLLATYTYLYRMYIGGQNIVGYKWPKKSISRPFFMVQKMYFNIIVYDRVTPIPFPPPPLIDYWSTLKKDLFK